MHLTVGVPSGLWINVGPLHYHHGQSTAMPYSADMLLQVTSVHTWTEISPVRVHLTSRPWLRSLPPPCPCPLSSVYRLSNRLGSSVCTVDAWPLTTVESPTTSWSPSTSCLWSSSCGWPNRKTAFRPSGSRKFTVTGHETWDLRPNCDQIRGLLSVHRNDCVRGHWLRRCANEERRVAARLYLTGGRLPPPTYT